MKNRRSTRAFLLDFRPRGTWNAPASRLVPVGPDADYEDVEQLLDEALDDLLIEVDERRGLLRQHAELDLEAEIELLIPLADAVRAAAARHDLDVPRNREELRGSSMTTTSSTAGQLPGSVLNSVPSARTQMSWGASVSGVCASAVAASMSARTMPPSTASP
jgi:hypothetical protein